MTSGPGQGHLLDWLGQAVSPANKPFETGMHQTGAEECLQSNGSKSVGQHVPFLLADQVTDAKRGCGCGANAKPPVAQGIAQKS